MKVNKTEKNNSKSYKYFEKIIEEKSCELQNFINKYVEKKIIYFNQL